MYVHSEAGCGVLRWCHPGMCPYGVQQFYHRHPESLIYLFPLQQNNKNSLFFLLVQASLLDMYLGVSTAKYAFGGGRFWLSLMRLCLTSSYHITENAHLFQMALLLTASLVCVLSRCHRVAPSLSTGTSWDLRQRANTFRARATMPACAWTMLTSWRGNAAASLPSWLRLRARTWGQSAGW